MNIDKQIEKAMNFNKQIEKMAKDLCGRANCATCGELMPCFSKHFSKRAVEKGYRKASDVAREIFEELIDNATFIEYADGGRYLRFNAKFFAELKKKYLEGNE